MALVDDPHGLAVEGGQEPVQPLRVQEGVEGAARPPEALDHRTVEWALRLPRQAKASGRTEKELLRAMARAHLPELPAELVDRKKSPMPPPFDITAFG